MAIKINQRLAAPFVIWRGTVPAWMGRELGQETINKAHRSVRRHPPTFSQSPKVKTSPDFAVGAVLDLGKECVNSILSRSCVSKPTALGKAVLLKETLLQV